MAFNPAYERRRVSVRRPVSDETESCVLSESQSSWVLFDPERDNDVISLSNTNPLTTEGSGEAVSDYESDVDSDETDNDDLIDEVQPSLSSRIDQWQNATDAAVSDNIASWDLDSDLVAKLLDTSVLRRVPAYYGDTYFENMSKQEYARFKRASAILRKSLTKKGAPAVDKDLITRLLQLLQWQNLLTTSGTLVNDYIMNTLARTQPPLAGFRDVEYSDTATSSSMVLCGGGTWNDI
ncbi:hypothetical protein FDK38_003899 [Candidozyma auris]|nr:hypothetical protein FDK38_003899 [[Candida] auris]